MSNSSENVVIEVSDGILTLTLNRPEKKNAIDASTYADLTSALDRASSQNDITSVVITGAGDYFCSGADVTASLHPSMADPATAPVGKFMTAVVKFPKILVAAVNGPAVGIGVTLLPHCDLVYSAASASFWVPFVRIAVVPEFGSSVTFPRLFGPAVAGDLLFASRVMSAQEALQRGLVSELMPANQLLNGVRSKLKTILSEPLGKESLLMYKGMLRKWTTEEMEAVLAHEFKILGKRFVDGDTQYAIRQLVAQRRGAKERKVQTVSLKQQSKL